MRAEQRWTATVLIAAIFCMALAARAETPMASAQPAASAKGIAPLTGPLKLTAVKALPALPLQDGLDRAYEQFRQATARAKTARDAYVTARNQCSARSFSVPDQREAGCQPTDTVAQCNDKLEAWCTRNPLVVYRRANRVLSRASENLKTAMSAYITQVNQLPAED